MRPRRYNPVMVKAVNPLQQFHECAPTAAKFLAAARNPPLNKAMRAIVVLFCFLVMATRPACAWGPEGHQIVARIAADNLNPHARSEAAGLLGGDAAVM